MTLSRFFIDRPVFATVLAVVIVVAGTIAYVTLPVAQYPEVVPPTVVVTANDPGATPDVIADTVATPIEQEVNGVENMLSMSSPSTSDGQMQLTIPFTLGTDLNQAQVLVQNRVAVAEPRLPEDVRRIGGTTKKSSPDVLLVAHLLSPDNRDDQAYISNYALIRVKDVLARLEGVGDVTIFGAREYSMRVWLDPDKIAARNLTASDVVQALRQQNVQVASEVIGQPPVPQGNAYQLSVKTLGRLTDVEQFGNIVLKTGDDRRITRLRDVARVEVGARDDASNSYLDGQPAVGLGIFQRPGSNALATAQAVRQTMADLSQQFPEGLEYRFVYDPTVFVQESMHAVFETLVEAFMLVFIVVLIFLQDWRVTFLPMIDVPVSLIGTLGVMAALGFSLNNLSLFGLVLAIGSASEALAAAGNQQPGLVGLFTPFNANTPQLYADVDRTKATQLNVPLNNLFDTLQVYLGSSYVNDFNLFGRTYRVTAQADGPFRNDPDEIAKFKTRSATGAMVPLGSLVEIRRMTGPDRVLRYNMYPAAEINGDMAPGVGSGQAITTMEQLAAHVLPSGMGFEWTDLADQQILAGNTALVIFPICVLFVFLVLAAQYESWVLPLAIILIVPMCLLSAITGVWLRGMDNNILTQIGFVVLVALACKNALLIVEFAKEQQQEGKDRIAAAIDACRIRLRPILMTSFAFILGVLPLFVATGAGAEMLRALGTSVRSGMVGVTCFGLLLTPVFYVVIRWCVERRHEKPEPSSNHVGTLVAIALVPCLLLLSGCMLVRPDYKTPPLPVPAGFANQAQASLSTDTVETASWPGFQDAERTLLEAQDQLANSETRTATALVAVYKALGGRWEIAPEMASSKAL